MTALKTGIILAALMTARAGVAQQRPAAIIQEQLQARLTAALDSLAKAGQFSGAVEVRKGSAVVFARAYGLASEAAKRPNTVKTAFNIGSINKIFTMIAIRQLAAAGKLSVDSTLGTYWPDYPNASTRKATIKQLLEHRAGVGGNIFDAPSGGTRHDVTHNDDYLKLFVNESQAFAPGTNRRYCNACYVVLGMLIQRLSGEDYYRYIDRHVFQPAGMTHSAWYFADSLPANAAIGYTRDVNGEKSDVAPLHPNTDILPGRGSAAGGGYSTTGDLLRFLAALRAKAIPEGPPPGIGIAGGAPGLNAVLEGDLPGGYDLAVAANLDPPAAERLAEMVREWLGAESGQKPAPGPPASSIP